ncbi:mismatch-specific DNA-glycosylase [Gordonia rhizosphera]|uniref:G/U mismatch-specific DNA glycosylase n=1 Tax=Gordonia rhizosphera NBRC 16068 TaxID=1108045 RepID=K6WE64_9ACTN|nr:mismatch-specific DNA-glycosylase [Gordonia rhizosphera]GAB90482.1 G/U mismatch-specific DNA glycosylase [Gordonia rhizosphera NBRC 16068]
MGFTREQLQAFVGTEVPDLIGDDCRLLFVGINPGLWTAAVGAHFARPGNRFYPALYRSGIVDRPIDASAGMSDEDRALLCRRGVGITNIVARATATAAELSTEELRAGAGRLRARVRRVSPRVVAIAGITAYRSGFHRPHAVTGPQDEDWDGAAVWVVPNPSGLNAHETVDSLAVAYAAAARAAGVLGPE